MATIESSIYNYLSTLSTIVNLVGTKIFPITAPKDKALPFIVYRQIGGTEEVTAQTPSNTLIGPMFEFNAYAATPALSKAIYRKLRLAFKNFHGVMGTGGVIVSGIEQPGGPVDDEIYADEQLIGFSTSCDWQFWYEEVSE